LRKCNFILHFIIRRRRKPFPVQLSKDFLLSRKKVRKRRMRTKRKRKEKRRGRTTRERRAKITVVKQVTK